MESSHLFHIVLLPKNANNVYLTYIDGIRVFFLFVVLLYTCFAARILFSSHKLQKWKMISVGNIPFLRFNWFWSCENYFNKTKPFILCTLVHSFTYIHIYRGVRLVLFYKVFVAKVNLSQSVLVATLGIVQPNRTQWRRQRRWRRWRRQQRQQQQRPNPDMGEIYSLAWLGLATLDFDIKSQIKAWRKC